MSEAQNRSNEPTEAAYRPAGPTISSVMVHHAEFMRAESFASNAGSVSLKVHNGAWESFSVCIFTDSAALSVELTEAINEVLAKHGRLEGQFDEPAEVAA